MTSKTMKHPGPDHPITIKPSASRVTVSAGGQVVADTREALVLQESTYPPVLYVPRKDVDMGQLQPTEHTTFCPFKGDCSYFSLPAAGRRGENAVWSYEAPFDAVAAIAGHLAFYPDRVDAIEQSEA